MRKFVGAILLQNGYTVLEAVDGAEGPAIGEREGRIDLLLTDVVMPNIKGGELAAKLKASKPGFKDLLQKPFNRNDLIQKVDKILKVQA